MKENAGPTAEPRFRTRVRGVSRAVGILALSLAASCSACAQISSRKTTGDAQPAPATTQAEAILRKLEQQHQAALRAADVKAVDRLTASGFKRIDSDGNVITRAELIAALKSGELQFQSIEYSEMEVHVTGDAALLTTNGTIKGQEKGKDIGGSYQFTRIYERHDGMWKIALQRDSRTALPLGERKGRSPGIRQEPGTRTTTPAQRVR